MTSKLILDNHTLDGGTVVYGLKVKEGVMLPTHAPSTRWRFAQEKKTELIITLGKRLQNGYTSTGTFSHNTLKKIAQCDRIINNYQF